MTIAVRKILNLLFVLVMVLSFSLVTAATPASASGPYLTMAVHPWGGGTTTPTIGNHSYAANAVVPITATASGGYVFHLWTATSGTFASASSASTNFTMPASGNPTVTANFWSTDATVNSYTYTVTTTAPTGTITGVPNNTSKTTFESKLKGESNQTWNDTNIHNPVLTGDTLVVTAQDTVTQVTYTVTLESTDATLSSLVVSGDGTLKPTFVSGTYAYADNVTVDSITVTPTVSDTGKATVKVNGHTVASGNPSNPINLAVGPNPTINIVVTAEDAQLYEDLYREREHGWNTCHLTQCHYLMESWWQRAYHLDIGLECDRKCQYRSITRWRQ